MYNILFKIIHNILCVCVPADSCAEKLLEKMVGAVVIKSGAMSKTFESTSPTFFCGPPQ